MAVAVRLFPGAIDQLINSPNGPVGRDLARRAERVRSTAAALAAVDTGRMRASVVWIMGRDGIGLFALIGSNVVYAIFVELGTRYMRAQPFLVPALRAAA